MPSRPWRVAAALSFAIGAAIAWVLFRDSSVVLLRVIVGGLVGMGIGLYLVETIWERKVDRSTEPALPLSQPLLSQQEQSDTEIR